MKKYILIIFFMLGFNLIFGQNICTFSPEYVNLIYCLSGYTNYNDNINSSIVVDDILAKLNLKNTYFVTKVCSGINNAVAIKHNGIRYILLDVDWMESIKYGRNDWFHLFVIGHEMAHHLLKHTETEATTIQISRKNELDADEFGGYILGLFGASKTDINTLLINFQENNDLNSTHPPKKDRDIAINKGFLSSKKSESNLLLQSLTKDADFNLNNLPYLLTLGRSKFSSFLKTNDKKTLLEAIEFYQEALRFTSDPQISCELGSLFLAKGDKDRYQSTFEFAYQQTKDEKYIVDLLSRSIEGNYNVDFLISKYRKIVDGIKFESISDITTLSSLSCFFGYMSSVDINKSGIDSLYLDKAKNTLQYAIGLINKSSKMSQHEYFTRGELYNELGLCENKEENYEKAFGFFLKAKSDFETGNLNGPNYQENIYCYYSKNILTVQFNLALDYVRLREWKQGLLASELYENTFNNLSDEKKNYLINTLSFDNDEIYYIKGRCYHGLEKYEEAIKNYTFEIMDKKSSLRAGSVYYYRGLSFIGLGRDEEACNDFKNACDHGINEACIRFNTTCKK